mmetsp:Transcript_39469/g.91418  ORF Transcript_39469/g.91418 Transcript_39469/m.91418 type:complete len:271 (-) Transcript_39469:244-1056(-)
MLRSARASDPWRSHVAIEETTRSTDGPPVCVVLEFKVCARAVPPSPSGTALCSRSSLPEAAAAAAAASAAATLEASTRRVRLSNFSVRLPICPRNSRFSAARESTRCRSSPFCESEFDRAVCNCSFSSSSMNRRFCDEDAWSFSRPTSTAAPACARLISSAITSNDMVLESSSVLADASCARCRSAYALSSDCRIERRTCSSSTSDSSPTDERTPILKTMRDGRPASRGDSASCLERTGVKMMRSISKSIGKRARKALRRSAIGISAAEA